jgi:hypothetical protein
MKQNTENIGKIYDKEVKAKELNKDSKYITVLLKFFVLSFIEAILLSKSLFNSLAL